MIRYTFLLLVTHVLGVQKFYTHSTANTFGDFSLGAGYDISRYEPKATHLFKEGSDDLLYDIMPITSTKTRCELITSQKDLSDKLYVFGSLSITYNMITGSGEISYDQKKETMSKVAYYTCTVDRTLYTISVNAPVAGKMEDLEAVIPENILGFTKADEIEDVVGDYHIRSITYGRRYNTEIRLEYTSEDAFEMIGGKLKAKIGVGALSVSAEVQVQKDWHSFEQDLKLTIGSEALGFVEKAPLFLPTKDAPKLDTDGNEMKFANGTVMTLSPQEQIDAMIKQNLDAFNALDATKTLKPETGLTKSELFERMDDAYPLWYTVEKNQPYFAKILAKLTPFEEAQMLRNLNQAYDILRELEDMTENIQRRAEKLFDSYHLLSGATELSIEFLKYRQGLMDEIVIFRKEALDYIKEPATTLCEKDIYYWAASSRLQDSEEIRRTLEYVSIDILHTKVWDLLGMEDVPMDDKNDIGATCLFNGIQAMPANTTERRKFAGRVVFGDLTVRHVLFDVDGKVVSLGFIDHEHANRDNETWTGVPNELVFVREDCTLLRKGSDVWYKNSRYTISYIGSEEHLTPRGYVNKQKLTNIRLNLQPKDTTRDIQVVITDQEVKDVTLRGHETSYGFTVDKDNRLMYKNGYVCDHNFKKTEANMICTTLGYEDVLYSKTGFEIPAANAWGRPHITMTDLKCKEMARGLDNNQCEWLSGEQMNEMETPWKHCGTRNGVQLHCVNGWVPNQNSYRMEIESQNVSCSRNEDSMGYLIDTAHSCSGGEGDDASNFGHVQEVTVKGAICVKLFRGDQLDCVVNEQADYAWDFTKRDILEKFCYSESLSDNLLPFPEKFKMITHDRPEPCSDDETKLVRAELELIKEVNGTETTIKLEKCEEGKKFGLCKQRGRLDDNISIDDASHNTFHEFCAKACGTCEVSKRKQYEVKVIANANSFEYDDGNIIPVDITIKSEGNVDPVKHRFEKEKEEFVVDLDYHCGNKIQFLVEEVHGGYSHGRQHVECRMSMLEGAPGRMEDGVVLISGDIHVTFHCSNPPSVAPTENPTVSPSVQPSVNPTMSPSTASPSVQPNVMPTNVMPTVAPSSTSPTAQPSVNPSTDPSTSPTASPSEWKLVFRQTTPYKWKRNEWTKNADDPSADNYAILNGLSNYRDSDGRFYFKLVWPGNEAVLKWSQASDPRNEPIQDYQAISGPSYHNFGGLEPSSAGNALMDGDVDSGRWWFAVGAERFLDGGKIPASDREYVDVVELYVLPRGKSILIRSNADCRDAGTRLSNSRNEDSLALCEQLCAETSACSMYAWPVHNENWFSCSLYSESECTSPSTSGPSADYDLYRLSKVRYEHWQGSNQKCEPTGNAEHSVASRHECEAEARTIDANFYSYLESEKSCFYSFTCSSIVSGQEGWAIYSTLTEQNADGSEYLGCYQDDSDRDLDTFTKLVSSVDECNSSCIDYNFFALQNYHPSGTAECWCGNNYGESGELATTSYSQKDNSQCPERSSMDGARVGASWTNAIYTSKNYFMKFAGFSCDNERIITTLEECRWAFQDLQFASGVIGEITTPQNTYAYGCSLIQQYSAQLNMLVHKLQFNADETGIATYPVCKTR